MGVNIGDTHVASLGDPVLIKPQNTLVNSASEVRPSFCPGCGEPTAPGHKFCPYCRFELHSLPPWQTVGAMPWAVPVHTPNLLTALNKLRYVEAPAADVQRALAALGQNTLCNDTFFE